MKFQVLMKLKILFSFMNDLKNLLLLIPSYTTIHHQLPQVYVDLHKQSFLLQFFIFKTLRFTLEPLKFLNLQGPATRLLHDPMSIVPRYNLKQQSVHNRIQLQQFHPNFKPMQDAKPYSAQKIRFQVTCIHYFPKNRSYLQLSQQVNDYFRKLFFK